MRAVLAGYPDMQAARMAFSHSLDQKQLKVIQSDSQLSVLVSTDTLLV